MLLFSSLFQTVVQIPVVSGLQGGLHQLDEKHHQSGRPDSQGKAAAREEIQEVK